MLTQLTVKNLAIVEYLELNFDSGMHVITGETGAGKSIIIDALSIALGERASAEQIRVPHTQAEVIACFDISKLPMVQEILRAQDLNHEECVIRRIINNDGRSRAYINGSNVAVQQIKMLAPYLVQIHSQHQHHALLESDYQRQLLDAYAGHNDLVAKVQSIYKQWQTTKQQIQELADIQLQADKLTLLNYQIQELEALNLQADELLQLDQKHTELAKGQELITACQSISNLLGDATQGDGTSILDQLHSAQIQLTSILKIAPIMAPCAEMLQQTIMLISETQSTLQNYANKLDLDPALLDNIERRLSTIHALARKLKVAPEFLNEHYMSLCAQRSTLISATENLDRLQQQLQTIQAEYQVAADQLSNSRKQAAAQLTKDITLRLKSLEMPNAVLAIESEAFKNSNPTPYGNEQIHFKVSANPGQPLGMLNKIASGGELSRISLAIQVITAQQAAIPTLILDEVDVGISGKTAATVGALMRELGANAQILCITHLPQVAAQGHHHFKVVKQQTQNDTVTKITPLSHQERVQELARLIGDSSITPEALAHAEKLIVAAQV